MSCVQREKEGQSTGLASVSTTANSQFTPQIRVEQVSTPPSSVAGDSALWSPRESDGNSALALADGASPKKEKKLRKSWAQDDKVKRCTICNGEFGTFNRRHHCRQCNRCVCDTCSPYFLKVDGFSDRVRVCNTCRDERQTAGVERLEDNLERKGMSMSMMRAELKSIIPAVQAREELLTDFVQRLAEAHGEAPPKCTNMYEHVEAGTELLEDLEAKNQQADSRLSIAKKQLDAMQQGHATVAEQITKLAEQVQDIERRKEEANQQADVVEALRTRIQAQAAEISDLQSKILELEQAAHREPPRDRRSRPQMRPLLAPGESQSMSTYRSNPSTPPLTDRGSNLSAAPSPGPWAPSPDWRPVTISSGSNNRQSRQGSGGGCAVM